MILQSAKIAKTRSMKVLETWLLGGVGSFCDIDCKRALRLPPSKLSADMCRALESALFPAGASKLFGKWKMIEEHGSFMSTRYRYCWKSNNSVVQIADRSSSMCVRTLLSRNTGYMTLVQVQLRDENLDFIASPAQGARNEHCAWAQHRRWAQIGTVVPGSCPSLLKPKLFDYLQHHWMGKVAVSSL